jgi:membrane-associated phospholipid phosphatase
VRRTFAGLRRFISARLDPRSYLGLHLTIALAIAAGTAWLLGALWDAVLDNATVASLDVAAANWIHDRATHFGLRVFSVISEIGSPVTMAGLALAATVSLRYRGRTTLSTAWIAAYVGGALIEQILKHVVHRHRPPFGELTLDSFSFPSGHSLASTIGLGMLTYVLLHLDHPTRRQRVLATLGAVAVVLAIGISRVYLGMHYPSDVLAGFAAGGAWLSICLAATGVALHADRARDS